MKTIATIVFFAQALPAVLAFCCSGPQCADGTAGTPCCATQSCNIFCCACGGHCRTNSKMLLERDPSEEAFATADSAGNGNLTLSRKLKDFTNDMDLFDRCLMRN